MLTFEPATRRVGELVARVTDGQLTGPTPCEKSTLGDLLDHLSGLAKAFVWAARKDPASGADGPSADAARLGADFRTGIPAELTALAEAWRDPQAWQGMTRAGGIELPGEVAGLVALSEVVIHGWDVARASDQAYDVDPATLDACLRHVSTFAGGEPIEGLFGRAVEVPADAPPLDRLIAGSGRDPAWTRPRSSPVPAPGAVLDSS
jgi:uncharacterized protein (TIGR03086 family)